MELGLEGAAIVENVPVVRMEVESGIWIVVVIVIVIVTVIVTLGLFDEYQMGMKKSFDACLVLEAQKRMKAEKS